MRLLTALLFSLLLSSLHAQPVTGTWRGKISKGLTTYKVEVKVILQGDSLRGTSYYYANANHYYRYAIKGYTDPVDGSLHWWDDELIEKKGGGGLASGINSQPLQVQADFNCPGAGVMKLDGEASTAGGKEMELHFDKYENPLFADVWDEIIANWHYGGADPDWIAQADQEQRTRATTPPPAVALPPATKQEEATAKQTAPVPVKPKPVPVETRPQPRDEKPVPAIAAEAPKTPVQEQPRPVFKPLSVQEKFETRQRLVQTTIPLAGDSIELQFFDNAEIDGDSIALFLNNRLLFEHVKLSAEPFILRLAVSDLPADAELSMVAENLGAIPPNTSFMMAYVNGERHTARLESTEKTTAVIRFRKE